MSVLTLPSVIQGVGRPAAGSARRIIGQLDAQTGAVAHGCVARGRGLCARLLASPRGPAKFTQKLVILGFDGMDPASARRSGWTKASCRNISTLAKQGGFVSAADHALARIADRVGVVRDRRQRRQAQHLRLPGARHRHRTCPTSAWSRARRRSSCSTTSRSSKPKVDLDPRRHVVLGDGRQAGRPLRHAHRAGDVPARGRRERRAALGPAAARHPRDDGHLLVLRDRSEPLRRGQHRDGRHPQAARLRGRHGDDRARRPAEPDRPAADRSDPPQGAGAQRQRQDAARRAAGRAGRPHPVHDPRGTAPARRADDRRSTARRCRSSPASGRRGSISPSR